MRILILQHQDHASYGANLAMSLKAVGYDCDSYCLISHAFNYQNASSRKTVRFIKQQIQYADLIIVCHSCGTMWDLVKHTGKRIWVFHTGTKYRTDPAKHNERWNGLAEKVFIALGEFENLGAKNPIYLGITVDITQTEPRFFEGGKLKIAHYPSNASVKGSDTINRIMHEIGLVHGELYDYKYSNSKLDHKKQLARMSECDIYVEMCATEQGGNPYGSYGTTAIEAAAMGKIVFTNMLWPDIYNKFYGKDELVICNNEIDLKLMLQKYIKKTPEEIKQKQIETHNWARSKHSFKATGSILKKHIDGQY